ncbi:hypothetical protein ACFX13_035165 [Malus domestica]
MLSEEWLRDLLRDHRGTAARLWKAAEMLRIRVPTRAQVGFVGSVLLSAEIHRLEVANSDEIAGNSLGACSPGTVLPSDEIHGVDEFDSERVEEGGDEEDCCSVGWHLLL